MACSEQALAWLRRLIAFPTTSGNASNLDLLSLVEEFLAKAGFSLRYTYSDDGKRANLFASYGGLSGGLLLSGHTDVVPVTGQNWTHPPFELTEEAGRLYGRGSCDMKGYLACILAVIERTDLASLRSPLHIGLTYDEEIGCVGVRRMLADLEKEGVTPGACVVGEPTRMSVVRAHKGRHSWKCHVEGRAEHSSFSGMGVNAAETACRLIAEISRQAEELQKRDLDDGFYVPYSTMAVCRVNSGYASNVIPEAADFEFDLRYLPSADPERILAPIHQSAALMEQQMQARVGGSRITLQRRSAVPPLIPREREDALAQLLSDAGAKRGSHIAFTTEGGLYQAAGIPTVVCGPGDIAQAHTADEYVERSELAACEEMIARLLQPAAL